MNLKRSVVKYFFIYILFILAILCVAFFQVDQKTSDTTRVFVSTAFAALTQMEGKLNPTAPLRESPERFVFRNGLVRSLSNILAKPFLLILVKDFSPKLRINSPGFFIPAIVFLIFFQFYQNSRTSSEIDTINQAKGLSF